MTQEAIIAYVDKSVVKVTGLRIKGLNTQAVEDVLSEKLGSFVRVIGVTGSEIQMDVYNINPESVRKNAKGLIEVLALTEGITTTEVAELSCSERIAEVDFTELSNLFVSDCAREKWRNRS
jgi:hypothetical protein